MCGGRGTRMTSDREKPLVPVGGRPTVDRVFDALRAADRIDTLYAAVSPNAPETRDHVGRASGVRRVETPGDGYVADLTAGLDRVGEPAVTVAADLPLLSAAPVDRVVRVAHGRDTTIADTAGGRDTVAGDSLASDDNAATSDDNAATSDDNAVTSGDDESASDETRSVTVVVPARLKRALGASTDERAHAEDASGVWLPTGLNVVGGSEITHRSWDARLAVNVNYAADVTVAERLLAADREGSDA